MRASEEVDPQSELEDWRPGANQCILDVWRQMPVLPMYWECRRQVLIPGVAKAAKNALRDMIDKQ